FFDDEKYRVRCPPLLERGFFLEKETALLGSKRHSRIVLLINHGELALEVKPEAAGNVRRAFKKHLTVRPQSAVQEASCLRQGKKWGNSRDPADHAKTDHNHSEGEANRCDFFASAAKQINRDDRAGEEADCSYGEKWAKMQPGAPRHVRQCPPRRPATIGAAPRALVSG